MPDPRPIARRHYERRQVLARATVQSSLSAWSQLRTAELAQSWIRLIRSNVLPTVIASQTRSAATADSYVDEVLAAQGYEPAAAATIAPRAFASVASDGRDLTTLLFQPVVAVKSQLAHGSRLDDALELGGRALTNIIATQVADAGRIADGTAIVARADTGWVRMINPPACSRCAILAGQFFRWNRGFARHPRCDCVHIPSTENIAGDLTTDPARYFGSLSPADQDRLFTKAGAEAIRSGSDIGQVVNARRGMYQADGHLFTREATTRRGAAGKRLAGTKRLMPESIFADARDRDHALELLRRHGYLT